MNEYVGINAIAASNISIYPNPTSDILTIRDIQTNSSIGIQKIEILDLSGRLIKQYNNTSTIDISCLAKGTYLLMYVINDEIVFDRIIKE